MNLINKLNYNLIRRLKGLNLFWFTCCKIIIVLWVSKHTISEVRICVGFI